nr:hypothetical protein [Deltaproteobacteria bacterium]
MNSVLRAAQDFNEDTVKLLRALARGRGGPEEGTGVEIIRDLAETKGDPPWNGTEAALGAGLWACVGGGAD